MLACESFPGRRVREERGGGWENTGGGGYENIKKSMKTKSDL
jgi:hypothetical protein